MRTSVLLGDPAEFRIRSGANPHTRDRWGFRKRVDPLKAAAQWAGLKQILEAHGVQVHVLPAVEGQPGTVFPANAGFRHGDAFYLSNLHPGRAGEREHYRRFLSGLGLTVEDLPVPHRFEGEADFIPVEDRSGDPRKRVTLFTYGKIGSPGWRFRFGLPPYRRQYRFRSDRRVLPTLQSIVGESEILPLELVDERHYHGDTLLCPFGPSQEYLLAYLEAISPDSRAALRQRLGDRLVPLTPEDGRAFAANSFQVSVERAGQTLFVLFTPEGLTGRFYREVTARGVIPCPVDVSEFLEKGGGAVKCMLLNLGP